MAANRPADPLRQLNHSVEALVGRVAPAVVEVEAAGVGNVPVDHTGGSSARMGKWRSIGSGIIMDSEGYILTNAHVVRGAQSIRVVLTAGPSALSGSPGSLEKQLEANLIGMADETDLALLKVEAHGLPKLQFGDYRRVRQGQVVFAFGSPKGLRNSVTMGVISAVAREPFSNSPMTYIQTDAPVNSGNSGGPLVDISGDIVGLNTLILTEGGGNEEIAFAIPSHIVALVYQQLRTYGHVRQAEIGAAVQNTTPELVTALGLPTGTGVVVSDVVPGSPAEIAGLKVRDQIIKVDDASAYSVADFKLSLLKKTPGDHLKVIAVRGGSKLPFDIRTTETRTETEGDLEIAGMAWNTAVRQLLESSDPAQHFIENLSALAVEIDMEVAAMFPGLRESSGVIVLATATDEDAIQTPLQPGDVIHALNGSTVTTLQQLRADLDARIPGTPAVMQVERDGKLQFITVSTDE